MSDPYDPQESDLRKQLTETRLMLHHERCRHEQAEAACARAERRLALVVKEACTIINRYWSQNLDSPEAVAAVRRWEEVANLRHDA